MKTIFTAFLLFFSLMIQAQTTYYIDPAGSDASGNGTIGNPWKSLYKACATVRTSGNIIHVNAGTFPENSKCSLAIGVSIIGEGVTSIITSNYAGSADKACEGVITLNSAIANPINGNQSISYIKLDGNGWTAGFGIAVNFRFNVSIHHCTVVNFNYYGIVFSNNNLYYPHSPTITYASGSSIHDCILNDCEIRIEGYNGFLLYNNTVNNTQRSTTILTKCLSSEWMKGFKIYNNTFTKLDYSDTWNFFFETWHYSDESEIYNNIFNGSAVVDIVDVRKGAGSWGLKVYNNQWLVDAVTANSTNDIQALDIEERGAIEYVYVYNNYFKNCVSGIWLDGYTQHDQAYVNGTTALDHIYIYYNIFDNIGCTNKAWVYTIQTADGAASGYSNNCVWDNIWICNNILKSAASPNQNMHGLRLGNSGPCTNFHIDNNIVVGYPSSALYNGAGANYNTISVQKNLFYQNGTNDYVEVSASTNKTQTSPALVDNPLFVSSADFHLQAGSPAINNGVNITLPVSFTDYDGNPVGNPPEIGAYEFISSDNHSPLIQDQGFQLNENSPSGTSIGTVVASDPDAGQTLTYSIVSGNTNGAFTIDALTGVLSVANGATLTVDFALLVKVQDNGIGELSSQATITIDVIPTGIELTGNSETIKVYPNPVSDELFIEIEGNNDKQGFEILNTIGHVVFKGTLSERTVVPTTNFSPGIYVIKLQNGKSFEFKKIIKL